MDPCRSTASSASPRPSSPSIRKRWRAPVLVLAAIGAGAVGWSGHVLALPVALIFPVLWSAAPSRSTAALLSAGYFLAASRGLPQGVAAFFASDLWLGALLWLGASTCFILVQTTLWTKRTGPGKGLRFLIATLLMAIPPFGITGWAQPITAAGVLFPGWGWWGMAATVVLLGVLATRRWPLAAIIVAGFWSWFAASWTSPALPTGWTRIDLELGQTLGRDATLERQRDLARRVRRAAARGARVAILPESALGLWTPTLELFWRHELRAVDMTVIAGAVVIDRDGYDNVMVEVSAAAGKVLYRERMPVPVSMWQPWRTWVGQPGGARAHLFADPVAIVESTRIVPLICYEQLLVWPILQSMLGAPDLVVGISNAWWTAGSSIAAIQQSSMIAWAKLFHLRLIMAFNT
ncbi:conjugal transfer protein TraB [Xanthobacter sp. V7C-1B]